jgi:hypothetical protein
LTLETSCGAFGNIPAINIHRLVLE